VGIGSTVSPKELASVAFSSSTIFKSGANGLVHTLNNMQSASVTSKSFSTFTLLESLD